MGEGLKSLGGRGKAGSGSGTGTGVGQRKGATSLGSEVWGSGFGGLAFRRLRG